MRNLSPEFQEELVKDSILPGYLLFLDIEGDPVRAWTGYGTVVYDGETYLGVGAFGSVDPIDDFQDIRESQVKVALNNIPEVDLSEITDLNWKGRLAELHLGMFSESFGIIAATTVLSGTMDNISIIREPDGTTIEATIVNELTRLRDSWGYFYTQSDHQRRFPDDTSLRFIPYIQDTQISL